VQDQLGRRDTKVILIRAPRVPVHTGTHGEPLAMTGRTSLTVHQNVSQFTARYGPHLCTAGVEGSSPFVSTARNHRSQVASLPFSLLSFGQLSYRRERKGSRAVEGVPDALSVVLRGVGVPVEGGGCLLMPHDLLHDVDRYAV
jgi:hypothetical protein